MFELPRFVIKAGVVVVDDGEPRPGPDGSALHVAPEYVPSAFPQIEAWFNQHALDPLRQLLWAAFPRRCGGRFSRPMT